MIHSEVYNRFKALLPIYEKLVTDWFPNGYNSIRLRLKEKGEFIFTIGHDDNWCFETVDSWIRRLKGENTM